MTTVNAIRQPSVIVTLAAAGSALLVPAPVRGQGYFDGPIPPAECGPDDVRIEVLLLGSYHMSNPGADAFNLEADDVLAPKRQEEILAVVDRLAAFEPTHVAVEAPWGDSATLERWASYRAGGRELRRSEEEQIGFRLARRMNHETIHPIDVRMSLDFESMGAVAARDPRLARLLGGMQAVGEEAIATMARWLEEGSIGSMLARMNAPGAIAKTHMPYIEFFAPIAVGDDYAGADMLAEWYRRNLSIFANLTRIAHEGDERVFLIFGAGHIPILRQLVVEHPDYCVEDPLPYLEGL